MPSTLLQSELPGLDLIHRGKVRDVYALPDNELLIVATDRLSAFDVVLPDPVPGKGVMLTRMSNFWFAPNGWPNGVVPAPSRRSKLARAPAITRSRSETSYVASPNAA